MSRSTRDRSVFHPTPQLSSQDMAQHAAEEALVDRRMFRLDDAQWQAFQDVLDRPVRSKPRLAKLLAEKSVLE